MISLANRHDFFFLKVKHHNFIKICTNDKSHIIKHYKYQRTDLKNTTYLKNPINIRACFHLFVHDIIGQLALTCILYFNDQDLRILLKVAAIETIVSASQLYWQYSGRKGVGDGQSFAVQ